MKRAARIAAVLAAIVALAPAGARADHCATVLYVYSWIHEQPTANYTPLICAAEPGHDVDGRLLWPGTDAITIGYFADHGVETLEATLDGLGFNAQPVTLTRGELLGTIWYASPRLSLPAGPVTPGCVTAAVTIEEGDIITSSYHTAGGSCPDFP